MSKKRGKQHTKAWRDRRKSKPQAAAKPARLSGGGSGTVQIRARSMETLALDEPLRFPVPSTAMAFGPDIAEYWWKLIEYATDLLDPSVFPAVGQTFTEEERRILRRFIKTTQDLAASTALNHPISLTVNLADDNSAEEIITDDPPVDAIVGMATLLRQCYADDEKASFRNAWRIISHAVVRNDGPEKTVQLDHLERWKKAVGATQARSIHNQVVKQLMARGVIGADPELEQYPDADEPQRLLSDYFYGGDIHWDRKAAVVEERQADPFTDAFFRHDFFKAVACFAHLYIGFAELIEAALQDA
jgi:hypothetical protein